VRGRSEMFFVPVVKTAVVSASSPWILSEVASELIAIDVNWIQALVITAFGRMSRPVKRSPTVWSVASSTSSRSLPPLSETLPLELSSASSPAGAMRRSVWPTQERTDERWELGGQR